ncbi:hypothetical protein [Chitinophaga nivalis]|uniref:Uncharacterized protein n=1 Tax=Chitinophaga nivalis TaxID=2991709 RepID=A0ABT3IUR8_9BACT|nr:hypothetical protein [Chitinophaga nivalis]MCW3462588.1 hypothetical protein [Chitinophaga nivalis]MCW3487721.1 hypothetical protein [Chitinophaga nivalis]
MEKLSLPGKLLHRSRLKSIKYSSASYPFVCSCDEGFMRCNICCRNNYGDVIPDLLACMDNCVVACE